MSISFNQISPSLRIPIVAAEFDASQANQGPALLSYKALLIGQILGTASGIADTIVKVTDPSDLISIAGRGSMLHRMAIAWFASNRETELCVGLLDDSAGNAAEGTITVTGTATAAGTYALYLGGVRVPAAVSIGDDETAVAASIAAAINANEDLPATAASALGVVTVTHRHVGLVGNATDMRDSYIDGESLPAGISAVYVQLTGGTGTPDLANLIAAMGDEWYQIIAHPYTDATSLTAIETELSSRFGPMRMIDGVAITSEAGTHAELTTLGNSRNSQHSVIVAQAGENPLTPPLEFAAEQAAIAARYLAIDPARPLQTLPMINAVPPATEDLFTREERNLLLGDGIATTQVVANTVQVERTITTYQTNAGGAQDTAYLDITTLLTLATLRYTWRVRIQTLYPRHKLASDEARVSPGQKVMTPLLGKGEAVLWFKEMEALGLVEGIDQFKRDLIVERNASDPNRLDVLLPPDLINQLIVTAAQIAFRL